MVDISYAQILLKMPSMFWSFCAFSLFLAVASQNIVSLML